MTLVRDHDGFAPAVLRAGRFDAFFLVAAALDVRAFDLAAFFLIALRAAFAGFLFAFLRVAIGSSASSCLGGASDSQPRPHGSRSVGEADGGAAASGRAGRPPVRF
jgi:hypothetical protein